MRELVNHVVVGNGLTARLLTGVDRDEARALLIGVLTMVEPHLDEVLAFGAYG